MAPTFRVVGEGSLRCGGCHKIKYQGQGLKYTYVPGIGLNNSWFCRWHQTPWTWISSFDSELIIVKKIVPRMRKPGNLCVAKVWAQLTKPRDQLSHQIVFPCWCRPPCPPPCQPPPCRLDALWGIRDFDRMEIRKSVTDLPLVGYQPT